jgi:hypothetical protein
MLFGSRTGFGLTARSAALGNGKENEVPALAALRELVRAPDGIWRS